MPYAIRNMKASKISAIVNSYDKLNRNLAYVNFFLHVPHAFQITYYTYISRYIFAYKFHIPYYICIACYISRIHFMLHITYTFQKIFHILHTQK